MTLPTSNFPLALAMPETHTRFERLSLEQGFLWFGTQGDLNRLDIASEFVIRLPVGG